jgi:endonuclease/exonuclease/phosphatase family metal-dependent hydrolase
MKIVHRVSVMAIALGLSFSSFADTLPEVDLVRNGNFSKGTEAWTFSVNGGGAGGAAQSEAKDGAYHVGPFSDVGKQAYSIQHIQDPVNLVQGARYTLHFEAWASDPRPISVKIGGTAARNWKDYTGFGLGPEFKLQTAKSAFEYSFVMQDPGDAKARIEFCLGGNPAEVWITNVQFFGPAPEVSAAPAKRIAGASFVRMNGVSRLAMVDGSLTQVIGKIGKGDWASWRLPTLPAGNYRIGYRVSSDSGAVVYSDLNDGAAFLGEVKIPASGQWSTQELDVSLPSGPLQLRLGAVSGEFAVNWIEITPIAGPVASPKAPSPRAEAKGPTLSALSFNIRDGRANDPSPNSWAERLPRAAKTIGNLSPDVVSLQEPTEEQLSSLARASGYASAGYQGIQTILYNPKTVRVLETGGFMLSETPDVWDFPPNQWEGSQYPRYVIWARFEQMATKTCFYVYNNHWDYGSPLARQKSAQLLCSRIAARSSRDPFFILGDLNGAESEDAVRYLTGQAGEGMKAALPWPLQGETVRDTYRDVVLFPNGKESSFNDWNVKDLGVSYGGEKIDVAIFGGAPFITLEGRIVRDLVDGQLPSDHYPMFGKVRLLP